MIQASVNQRYSKETEAEDKLIYVTTMKFFVVAFTLLAVAACAPGAVSTGAPEAHNDSQRARLEDVDADGGLDDHPVATQFRRKRLTCDVFSFESGVVTPNHSACAAKCIFMGRAGGHCDETTCICREDKWVPW